MKNHKKLLEPKETGEFSYVCFEDIEKHHGKQWYERFCEIMGDGNTGGVVDGNCVLFYDDYIRFAGVVNYGKPTYFD